MMKLIRLLLVINLLIFGAVECSAQSVVDSLLNELNTALANKGVYVAKKQLSIAQLNTHLKNAKTLNEKYIAYGLLYEQYKSFSYDSAYTYAKKLQVSAAALNNPVLIASAKTKLAFTLLSSGLFKETLEELNSINLKPIPIKDKVDYYFLKARSYFDLSDYNRSADYTAIYNPQRNSLY